MSLTIKNILFAYSGICIEWYDFFLYICLSKFWVDIFFKGYSLVESQTAIVSIFCLSYFGRLVGGVIISFLADRYGRKSTFVFSSLLMTFASLLMFVFPLGFFSQPVNIGIFSLLRFFQGFSVGGETPGGQTYIYDH